MKGPDGWKEPGSREERMSRYFVGRATLRWSSGFSLLVFPVDFVSLHLAGGRVYSPWEEILLHGINSLERKKCCRELSEPTKGMICSKTV